jgi:hypothetical protein
MWIAFIVAPHMRLDELPGEDLKMVFSASDPAETRLAISLEESK